MPDLCLDWQDDLRVAPNGDLLLADGDQLVSQRIQRRLFTAVQGYLWHLEYGAGLPQRIGRTATALGIQSLVRAHIALESTVAKTPPPTVAVDKSATGLGAYIVTIKYTDADSGRQVVLSFDVSR